MPYLNSSNSFPLCIVHSLEKFLVFLGWPIRILKLKLCLCKLIICRCSFTSWQTRTTCYYNSGPLPPLSMLRKHIIIPLWYSRDFRNIIIMELFILNIFGEEAQEMHINQMEGQLDNSLRKYVFGKCTYLLEI